MKNNLQILTLVFIIMIFNLSSYSQSTCTYNNGISIIASQTSNSTYWDSMAIYFISGATDGFDSKYDSPAQFPPASWDPNTPELWTRIPNSTKQIGGDGLPLFTTDKYVKLYLGYNNTTKTIATTLTAPKKCIKGFAGKTAIWLLDSLNPNNFRNFITDSSYAFTFNNPSDLKRFSVCFDFNGTGIPDASFSLSTGNDPITANTNVTITFTGKAPASASYSWSLGNAHVVSGDLSGQGPIVVYWDENQLGNHNLTLTVNGLCFSSQPYNFQATVQKDVGVTKVKSPEFNVKCFNNPLNDLSVLDYKLAERTMVNINLYDITGNKIAALVNNTQEIGEYKVKLNTSNLKSGIYFYKIIAGNNCDSEKIVILR
jgi:hypothetical protein